MNYTLKLVIPLGLGLVAAIINMMILRGATQTREFVRAKERIAIGQSFSESNLEKLELPGDHITKTLEASALPWESHGVLLDQAALRDFEPGDIIFYRDFQVRGGVLTLREGEVARPISLTGVDVPLGTLRIGANVTFLLEMGPDEEPRRAGPFRLLSVGDRLSNSAEGRLGGSANTITVALRQNPNTAEAEQQRLLDDFARKRQQNIARLLAVDITADP